MGKAPYSLQKSRGLDASPFQQHFYLEVKERLPEGKTVVRKRISLDHFKPVRKEAFLQMMEEFSTGQRSVHDSDD